MKLYGCTTIFNKTWKVYLSDKIPQLPSNAHIQQLITMTYYLTTENPRAIANTKQEQQPLKGNQQQKCDKWQHK